MENESVVNKRERKFPHKELTYKIIGTTMEMHKEIGYGFLEAAYTDIKK